MIDDTSFPSSCPPADEELPERLRVHALARILGTTSRKVLEALMDLDGKVRSAQSNIDHHQAVRVRDLLHPPAPAESPLSSEQPHPHSSGEESPSLACPPDPAGTHDTPPTTSSSEDDLPLEALFRAPTQEITINFSAVSESAPIHTPGYDSTTDQEHPPLPPTTEQLSSSLFLAAPTPTDPFQLGDFGTFSSSPHPDYGAIMGSPFVQPADYTPVFMAPQPVFLSPQSEDTDETTDEERLTTRRRRRGRRGGRRGKGPEPVTDEDLPSAPSTDTEPPTETTELASEDQEDTSEDAPESETDETTVEVSTLSRHRVRRRRRRRKAGESDEDTDEITNDDPPNTVIHERPSRPSRSPRSSRPTPATHDDEIQGISGSTRLEAKRQRRRDGRDNGRRRPPILSEAEFLARRESVERIMVVRDRLHTQPPHQGTRYSQIAVLEDGIVVEHFVTAASAASLVGNIYLGIVQNVLPSMEAAFVDIGLERNGVLYAGEVNWEAAGLGGDKRKIEQALSPGDYVVVQVSKDPIGHKGARLTTQISLAGRYLVYVPGATSTGISRKLPDTERQRLKEILQDILPADAGVIIRTASEGVKADDIRHDIERLQQRWDHIKQVATTTQHNAAGAPVSLYEEPGVLVKVIRDRFTEDFSHLVVSGDDSWETITNYINTVSPELMSKLSRYDSPTESKPDVFALYRIDEQLLKAMDRQVWLPSGGTLVIDRTEAMTVIDVNTGKFTGSGGNLEETVTKNNLEAAEEIVRQLRLRDIGGIIVIDFIDMVLESNRDLVLRRLTEVLGRDRTRHQVSEVTSLGLVQLTRKRLGTGLIEAFSTPCNHCGGRGIILHPDPVSSPGIPTKVDPSPRRARRMKKPCPEEPITVVKVPTHSPKDHPLFKAMAANSHARQLTGSDEDDSSKTLTDHDSSYPRYFPDEDSLEPEIDFDDEERFEEDSSFDNDSVFDEESAFEEDSFEENSSFDSFEEDSFEEDVFEEDSFEEDSFDDDSFVCDPPLDEEISFDSSRRFSHGSDGDRSGGTSSAHRTDLAGSNYCGSSENSPRRTPAESSSPLSFPLEGSAEEPESSQPSVRPMRRRAAVRPAGPPQSQS